MRMSVKVVSAVLAVGVLAGCSTTTPVAKRSIELDAERMAMIENVARQQGVEVIWVNPPTRAVKD